jgi:hypothetical protein
MQILQFRYTRNFNINFNSGAYRFGKHDIRRDLKERPSFVYNISIQKLIDSVSIALNISGWIFGKGISQSSIQIDRRAFQP